MKKEISLVLLALLSVASTLTAQQKPAYRIFDGKGKKVKYSKMLKELGKADVVLFGEYHDNPIAHWLELELTKDLDAQHDLVLGAEMLERDNQGELGKYLSEEIDQAGLDTLARLWPNYKTDYAPLIDYARTHGLPFIATNIPRRYANLVYRKDFAALDTLSEEEKSWMAPLPIPFDSTLPTYRKIIKMMGDHGSPRLVKAQAMKDATMAWSIVNNLPAGHLFLHFNGAFHSDYHEGIGWYLKQYKPSLRVKTISTVSQSDLKKLDEENLGKADFIIVVDEDMTSTY